MDTFIELCQKRRSIRKYKAEKIEREKIEQILQAALMAPAGKRLNPWEFIVVEDHCVLSRLSACRTYGSQMLNTAAAGIVIALDEQKCDTWMCDGAIAAHNMLLAATDLGLGACWMHVLNRGIEAEDGTMASAEEAVRRELAIPEHLRILCIISLGYKDEERKDYDLQKLQYDKVHYGQYQTHESTDSQS